MTQIYPGASRAPCQAKERNVKKTQIQGVQNITIVGSTRESAVDFSYVRRTSSASTPAATPTPIV